MLDQNVPNPLAKNPNFYTHKVFAAIGLILIGVVLVLFGLALIYHVNLADLSNTTPTADNTKISTSSTNSNSDTKSAEFSDKAVGVAFTLPTDWKLYGKDISSSDKIANRVDFVSKDSGQNTLSLYSSGPYKEIFNSFKERKVGVTETKEEGAYTITRREDIQLDGSSALVFESIEKNKQDPISIYEMLIYFQKGSTSGMLQIRTDETNPELYIKNKDKLLKAVVPTFKFL